MTGQSLRSLAAEALRLTRDKVGIAASDAKSLESNDTVQISTLSFKLDPDALRQIEAEVSRNEELLGLER